MKMVKRTPEEIQEFNWYTSWANQSERCAKLSKGHDGVEAALFAIAAAIYGVADAITDHPHAGFGADMEDIIREAGKELAAAIRDKALVE